MELRPVELVDIRRLELGQQPLLRLESLLFLAQRGQERFRIAAVRDGRYEVLDFLLELRYLSLELLRLVGLLAPSLAELADGELNGGLDLLGRKQLTYQEHHALL